MKTNFRSICLTSLIGAMAPIYAVPAFSAELPLDISTKGGLVISTKDKAYSMKLDGRIQADYNNYDGVMNADQGGDSGSDFFFRRARIGVSGVIATNWAYKAEFNINEGSGGDITDVYIRYKGWGKRAQITIGNQREHFGFENLTSSKNITAIERSAPSQAWDAGRNIGIALNGYGKNWTYGAGIYEAGQTEDQIDHAYTARATYVPYKEEGSLLHIGAGIRVVEGEVGGVNGRPGIRQVDGDDRISVDFDGLGAEDQSVANLELAGIVDSFHVSAEYFSASVDLANNESYDMDGYYVMAGWFLTGEARAYSGKKGVFDKVKPAGNNGAWEIFARFDSLNLEDQNIGNDGTVTTLGINWYANSQVRTGLNLVSTDYDNEINGEDDGVGIAARIQLTF